MKSGWKKSGETIAGVLVGNLVLAFAVTAFIIPHGIITGGATGIGIIITRYTSAGLSSAVLAVNGVLFFIGAFVLGKKFVITTIASTFLYPVCLSVVQRVPKITELTDNIMLAAVFGGIAVGIGIGLVLRVGASTGGTDILALVFHKWFHIALAVMIYVVDFSVLGCQVLFSNAEQVMYGLLMLVLETLVLNRVILMGQSQIQLFIISEYYEEVRERLLKELDAGVTMIYIETGYGREEQKGVLCIIPGRKLYSVKEMVQKLDGKAFITITRINEVRGRGFSIDRAAHLENMEESTGRND